MHVRTKQTTVANMIEAGEEVHLCAKAGACAIANLTEAGQACP